MTLAEEFRSRNFSRSVLKRVKKLADSCGTLGIYGQWSVVRAANPSLTINPLYLIPWRLCVAVNLYLCAEAGSLHGIGLLDMSQHSNRHYERGITITNEF